MGIEIIDIINLLNCHIKSLQVSPLSRMVTIIFKGVFFFILGGMQDYNYIRGDCMEITLEIACCKYPEENTLEAYWMENRKPLLEFLKQAHRGKELR